jgi:hypothetical protein
VYPLPAAFEELTSAVECDTPEEGARYTNPRKPVGEPPAKRQNRPQHLRLDWVDVCSVAVSRRDPFPGSFNRKEQLHGRAEGGRGRGQPDYRCYSRHQRGGGHATVTAAAAAEAGGRGWILPPLDMQHLI